MALNTQTANLDVTSENVPVEKLASLDVVDWKKILSHKTVLEQGVLPPSSTRNTLLFALGVSPRALQSATHKTIIKHLAEMFAQWHGTLVFELVVSMPYFVATKVVFAFVPDSDNLEGWPASTLAGFQNSTVFNPANESSVTLRVPFISAANWEATNASTGQVVAKLLDPIISSLDLTGGLPWTLFVSADPKDFSFRYVAPPLLQSFESAVPGIKDEPTLTDLTLARSMSTAPMSQLARAAQSWPLVQQSTTNTRNHYETMMLIPRSRVEFVIQKIRGQFPSGELPRSCVLNMFDIPASSLSSYQNITPPSPTVLYPYLLQPFLIHSEESSGQSLDFTNSPAPVLIVFYNNKPHLLFVVPPESPALPQSSVMWFTHYSIIRGTQQWNGLGRFQFVGVRSAYSRLYHLFASTDYMQNGFVFSYNPSVSSAQSCLATWDTSSLVSASQQFVIDSLNQLETCPSTVTHMALYTNMPPDLASLFTTWLTTADNSSPPAEAISYSISFSPNQSALAFNSGRYSEYDKQRGIVWRLFKLFKGDETKWWAWLVKGLDVVVDALIGAFLGRAGAPYVVPIGQGSGFRVEAVGAYSEAQISKVDPVPLEYIAPAKAMSLTKFFVSRATPTPLSTPSAAASQPVSRAESKHSSHHSSRRHRIHQARHPSKRKFF